MKILTRLTIMFYLLYVAVAFSGCGSSPVFVESGPPSSRIVVKYNGFNNCQSTSPVKKTLTTRNTRTSETSWSYEGKAGVGGKIPLGFLMPSLDIEAAITSHYGKKETRTWEDVSAEEYQIQGGSQLLYVVYYREVTRRGTIEISGKEIEYEFPAELSIIGTTKQDLSCTPDLRFQPICGVTADSPAPSLAPAYEGINRTWVRASPKDGEIRQVDVEIQDLYLVFHVQTDCISGPCDWGLRWACIWEDPLEVTFDNLVFKKTTLIFHPLDDGELRVTVWDHFLNPPETVPDQRTDYIFR